jgi:hypothetical protein
MVWLPEAVMTGDDGDFEIAGEPERKGIVELTLSNAPLDDYFRLDALLDTVHHQGHLPEFGEAPILGFFHGSGGQ